MMKFNMNMWTKNNKQTPSDVIYNFFNGESVNNKLQNSLFGKFMNIISSFSQNKQTQNIINKLPLPKVIVIGTESSGKSSLLENILKCAIFPRNSIICTKQPIHLILKTANTESEINYKLVYKNKCTIIDKKENIIDNINNIMNNILIDEIIDEEIHIEICDINLPNFEFYDLPGIRAYPEKLATETLKLTELYLQMANTIVLCVVPAPTPRITSYLPIALIKKYNKEKNTIIALTMADRIQEDNIYELLIKRIINETDEYNQNDFAGCVSIINRSHTNTKSLEENDKFADQWFYTNIIEKIPDNFPKEKIKLIKQNINVSNLINNLDNLYNNFIKESWIPNTLTDLTNTKTNITNKIIKLGEPIEDCSEDLQLEIFNYIINYILEKYSICLGPLIINNNSVIFNDTNFIDLYEFEHFILELKFLCSSLLCDNVYNIESYNMIYYDNIYSYNNNIIFDDSDNNYDIKLYHNYGEFAIIKNNKLINILDDNYNYNIIRFTNMIEYIINNMISIYNDKMNKYIEIYKKEFLIHYINCSVKNIQNVYNVLIDRKSLLQSFRSMIIIETKNKIKYDTKFNLDLLIEDNNVTELRNKYKLELLNIETTISQIESLKVKTG